MNCIECNTHEPNKESGLCDGCEQQEARKINGVLYLPALGIIVSIIMGYFELHDFIGIVINYFKESGVISYYSIGAIALLVVGYAIKICTAWFFFKRKRRICRAMTIYYVAGLIVALYFTVLPAVYFQQDFSADDARVLVGAISGVIIWIPYFFLSKRIGVVFSK